jgi:prepilin-type processing-associated H-X9-DG protein
MHSKLSMPVSYTYFGYFAPTQSSIIDLVQSLYQRAAKSTKAPGTSCGRYDVVENWPAGSLTDVDSTCWEEHAIQVVECDSDGAIWQNDLDTGFYTWDNYSLYEDDGETPYRADGHMRLKEGIERFMITDINNPGAASAGASTLFIMWDAYATGVTSRSEQWGNPDSGVTRFNHVPSGSNVLYMDGHVEFVRLNAKAPMLTDTLPDNSVAGNAQLTPNANVYENMWMYFVGVLGGAG